MEFMDLLKEWLGIELRRRDETMTLPLSDERYLRMRELEEEINKRMRGEL